MTIRIFAQCLAASFCLTGCQYPKKRIGIVHDYMIENAVRLCSLHGGLHYIVTDTSVLASSNHEYPCTDIYVVRCQDGSAIKQDTGIEWCFISESQIRESLEQK